MIAFACASSDERLFRLGAAGAIAALAEADSLLLRRHHAERLDSALGEMLSTAAARSDLEALVILEQCAIHHGEPDRFLTEVRTLLAADPAIALLGSAGVPDEESPTSGAHEVEAIAGPLLVVSPWAARTLRPDPAIPGPFAACAIDLSLQARSRGRRAVASSELSVSVLSRPGYRTPRRHRVRGGATLRRKWGRSAVASLDFR